MSAHLTTWVRVAIYFGFLVVAIVRLAIYVRGRR